jgi:DNA polymerase III delta subunit
MTTVPLAYVWGDDEYAIERVVGEFAGRLAAESGTPLERWDLRVERTRAPGQVADLGERLGTGVMFGGGTLAVAFNLGIAAPSKAGKDALIAMLGLIQPGNALAVVDLVETGKIKKVKGEVVPPQRALAEAIAEAGGIVVLREAPKAGNLAGWIAAQANDRGLALGPGAAKELAERIGGFVSQGDAERRYQTRTASMELDKLALYRGAGVIGPDDVRALVAEAVPGSVWAFTDAVGERRTPQALELLDRLFETTPEPVLLAVLHRRIRELLELGDRVAAGEALPAAAKAMGVTSEFRARTLSAQARGWTTAGLAAALDGLVDLDAAVKGAPGAESGEAQRRLAFSLWVIDHAGRARPGGD